MLQIEIPFQEFYNEATGEFDQVQPCTLNLEHSLISLSKWEAKWKKPFMTDKGLTRDEIIDYIRCMTLNQKVDPKVYMTMSVSNVEKIKDYIGDPATATTVYDKRPSKRASRDVITSELIYYQMIYFGIPFECEKWHLNRLLMLIRVCAVKGTPSQMSQLDIFNQNKDLNAARRMAMNSRG